MFNRAAIAALLLHVCFATLSSSQTYEAIELQRSGGADASRAYDINEAGVVVGNLGDTSTWTNWPVVWHNGVPTPLTNPQSYRGAAMAINEAGAILGTLEPVGFWASHVALWTGDSLLFLEGPNDIATGVALNDSGVAAGYVMTKFTECCDYEAFRSGAGGLERLPHAPGTNDSFATAINAAGDVVGYSQRQVTPTDPNLPTFSRIPALWSGNTFTALQDLPNGIMLAEARDINDAGVVVGFAIDDQQVNYAVRWVDGVPTALDDSYSIANAINASGAIVGNAHFMEGFFVFARAALWRNGEKINLHTAVETDLGECYLGDAVAINDAGQIIAHGLCPGDLGWWQVRSYLLTPKSTEEPEPDRTPSENLELLVERIGALRLGGQAESFLAKIDAALAAIARGAENAACNQLGALANAVAAQSGKALSAADAQAILDDIAAIRTQLGC